MCYSQIKKLNGTEIIETKDYIFDPIHTILKTIIFIQMNQPHQITTSSNDFVDFQYINNSFLIVPNKS